MIRIKLNDAIQVDVNTDDPAIATQEANNYFRQNFPREFSQWRNSQVGILGTIGRSYVAGTDTAEANLYAVAEGLGQSLNLPALQDFAQRGRQQATERAATVLPDTIRPPSFEEAQSPGDYARFAAGALGAALPSTVAPIAGGVAGGAIAGPPGAVIGAALAAYPELAGSNIRRQQEVSGGQITSPALAFGTAVPQALVEGAVDAFTFRLGRVLGKPVEEVGRTLLPRILRGMGVGAATEVPAEVFQQALERAQAGLDVTSPDAFREYKEVAAGAAVAGGALGGAARGIFGARPAATALSPEVAPSPEQPGVPTDLSGTAPLTQSAPTEPTAEIPPTAQAPTAETVSETQPAVTAPPATEVAPTTPSQEIAPATEVTPSTQVAPEATTQAAAMPTGFTTAKGSTYEINEFGQTIRTKRSEGPGQGTAYEPHNAVYVTPDVAEDLLTNMQSGQKYRLAIQTPDGPRYITENDNLQGSETYLVLTDRDGNAIRTLPFEKAPAVGLQPVELRYSKDGDQIQSSRHIGNPIVELRGAAPQETTQPTVQPAAQPTEEAAPTAPEAAVPTEQELWQGYSLNAGPQAANPIVEAARQIASARKRPFTREEFSQFTNQYTGPEATPVAEERPLNAEEELQAGPELKTAEQGRERLQRNYDDIFGKYSFLKYLSSPIMTLGKVVPAFKPVSDTIKTMYVRGQMSTIELGNYLEKVAKLAPESRAKVMLAMQEARSRQKAPDPNQFTAEENAAMQDVWRAGQRGYDYLIESYTRKYFDPAQLGGKNLWEFSDAQLEAMSPEGAKQIQKYNAMRDPFYFPQTALGSHFVAAYERQPNGKDKIVRLYAYTPLQGLAAKRFESPEVQALNYLRQEFPDSTKYRIMTRGIPFENDSRAQDLRVNGDFIARYLQELSRVSGKEGQRIIDRMSTEIDKAQMDTIFKPYKDIVRSVTPDNAASYALDVLPKYFLSLSKIQARRYVQDDFARAIQPLGLNDRSYWQDLFDYSTTPSEAYGAARGLAFFMYLGAAPDTALVNLTQTPFVTLPRLLRDGGASAASHLGSAYKTVVFNRAFSKVLSGELAFTNDVIGNILNKDEAAALIQARSQGIFTPLFTNESRGQFSADAVRRAGIADKGAAGVASTLNKGTELFGRFMQAAEETNRLVTFLAAYRLAKSNPKAVSTANYVDKTDYTSPYDYAANVVYDTQFITSKEDRALIQRFRPEAEVATQFMSFPLKMVEQYARHASMVIKNWDDPIMRKAGATALMGMITPMIAFAGVWSLPFADSLREIIERLMKLIWGDSINFKVESEKLFGRHIGQIFNYGLPHAYGYVSLQRRLGIDPLPVEELLSSSTLNLFGPVGGLIEKVPLSIQYYNNGDWWGLAATMLPRAVGNVVKGAQLEFDQRQYTRRGNQLVTPENLEKMSQDSWLSPSIRQAVGFPPPEIFNLRDRLGRQQDVQNAVRDKTERINMELSRYVVRHLEARDKGDLTEAARQVARLQERVNEINREQDGKPLDQRIIINPAAIRQRAIKDMRGVADPETLLRGTRRPGRQAVYEELQREGVVP